MSSSKLEIEKQIVAAGKTAPRTTPEMIATEVVNEEYYVFPNTFRTVCVLTLRNRLAVSGESACASPENFNEIIDRETARDNAREKIGPLLGFRPNPAPASEHSGFVKRMVSEANDLTERVLKLGLFIEGELFPTLPDEKQRVMRQQLVSMKHSKDTLKALIVLEEFVDT